MKDSFVLYTSYLEQVELLDMEQRGTLFTAMLRHVSGSQIPKMDAITQMLFSIIRNQIEKDAARYAETCERRKEAGKMGGRPRKPNGFSENQMVSEKTNRFFEKAKKPEYEYEYGYEYECDSENDFDSENENENDSGENIPPKSPLENVQEQAGEQPGRAMSAQDRAFDAFWALYPKKKSKGAAKKRWDKLNPSREIISAIMDKLPRLIASYEWQKDGGQYIPHAATWLNAEGWNDEVSGYWPPSREPPKSAYMAAIENRIGEVDKWV